VHAKVARKLQALRLRGRCAGRLQADSQPGGRLQCAPT